MEEEQVAGTLTALVEQFILPLIALAVSGAAAWLSAALKDGKMGIVGKALNVLGGNVGAASNDPEKN